MSKYFYISRDQSGKKLTGFEEATSPEEVVSRLQSRELIVINVIAEYDDVKGLREEIAAKSKMKFKHYRITQDDLTLFCRQLGTLLGAGVTILKSLDIISMQVASYKLFKVIKNLHRNMEGGLSLHESMSKHPEVFTELWVNLCESGEASGNLAMILNRLATYLERNAAFKRKVISAVIYPAILLVVGVTALFFITLKVIPTFAEIYKGFNITLPLLTRILIAVSAFLQKFLFGFIIFIGVSIYFFRRFIRTKEGRRMFENAQLKLPIFGELFRVLIAERFTSEMATLVESGVPILYSLEIAEHSVGHQTMAEAIRIVKEEVRQGKPLNQPLQKCGFFEPMAIQMITIGEEIGELSQMFKKINIFYQEYVETFLARFVSMFEPFMLIVMGFLIGTIVIGIFLPIFQISQIPIKA